MKTQTRRTFLKSSLITTAALSAGCKITSPTAVAPQSAQSAARVRGANEDIRIAVVGFGSRGGSHINAFKKMDGVRLVALCDVDSNILESHARKLREESLAIETYTDIRKLLENKNIDAISTATPNHWHAL